MKVRNTCFKDSYHQDEKCYKLKVDINNIYEFKSQCHDLLNKNDEFKTDVVDLYARSYEVKAI